ncbi:MAG: HEAT repeat domain-containing protein [Anaerolineaceae bacterium]|nr:MAG: HEAT repeat domain-containing protein [Anaerolineaceae bacterium]
MTNDHIQDDNFDEDALIEELLAVEGHDAAVVEPDLPPVDDIDIETEAARLQRKPDDNAVIRALREADEQFPGKALVDGLSDLSYEQMEAIRPTWQSVAPAIQRAIMRGLISSAEASIHVDYRRFGIDALDGDDPRVREHAIELLWEDQSLEVMYKLIRMAEGDDNRDVRAAALSSLGRYILMGEVGDLSPEETRNAEETVIRIWQNESSDLEVKRRALEAIANCSHEIVPHAIQQAYDNPSSEMRASAIFAIGRTADKRWQDIVMAEIDNPEPAIRYEAARAAGELALVESVPRLAEMTMEDDRELTLTAIWSLGEIGGRTAMQILETLIEKAEDEGDDDMIDALEDAIGNATLASELDDLDF